MHWLERQWYGRGGWLVPLLPLSALFGAVAALRRLAYGAGWLVKEALPVPVVVVGNISVGGTGKTPLVLWLARFLGARGWHPGIVSRGYGGTATGPRPVGCGDDPSVSGDEPLLLARNKVGPVWVGRDRVAAGRALLAAHPECDVVLCDDGLQHYRLARDVEIAVVDGARGLGNGWLLPAGPLREGRGRLDRVDGVVLNGGGRCPAGRRPCFPMFLRERGLHNLRTGASAEVAMLKGIRFHAVAGIGNPDRFFDELRGRGLDFEAHGFPDHHGYRAGELEWGDGLPVVMTEKDGVKYAPFASDRHWVLAVAAEVDAALGELVLDRLTGAK